MTVLHPHCGRCSQCIDRRFAVIAARQHPDDPAESYKVDLFVGERQAGPDREMALAYVRSASDINQMTDIAFFAHYGETSRIVDFFSEPTDTVARRIFELYRRHAAAVCDVFDAAIASHAPNCGKEPYRRIAFFRWLSASAREVVSIPWHIAFRRRQPRLIPRSEWQSIRKRVV